jgi:proteasome beta subunit
MLAFEDSRARRSPPVGTIGSGTTTIGMASKAGVVLATEHRATMGHFIANKGTVKLFRLDRQIGATFAGSVGDAQIVIRAVQAELSLHRLRRGAGVRVEGAATVVSNFLNANRFYPYFAWLIVGGVDVSGSHVFALDFEGGSIEDRFVSIGSGSPFAYGAIEESWTETTTLSEGIDLALRGLTAAMRRDSASGDGYAVATIDAAGYREVPVDEIQRRLSRLKISR